MTARIRGVVLDADGGPVPGARVALEAGPVPLPDIALLTGADGTFELDLPSPGEYVVAVHGDAASARARLTAPTEHVLELRLGRAGPQV
ncbi:carboxypeptidase regulatory-like domain-containing protein [uncultured Serinicoccus sp.]|uniref:carboxypeptidase-like regulatory domain-containing protein n=1 Tax=uncultured Serinicoccus sp. TaxID=735514 RepID=UPI002618EB72|nr:carboxypeptidase regulatory-like domain-containing protein [uncultured Serinicoccus sp.]